MSDARWGDPREYDARDRDNDWPRVYEPRDRDDHDPRDALMRDLDLPRQDEREVVIDRDRVYELDGEDCRTLAAVGAFRVVPENDLDVPSDTLENLHDHRLVETVDLGDGERGLTLTTEGRDLLDSHSLERDREPSQTFHAGVSRSREIDHDSNLYATFRQEEARLRDDHTDLEIRRVVLEQEGRAVWWHCVRYHSWGFARCRHNRNPDTAAINAAPTSGHQANPVLTIMMVPTNSTMKKARTIHQKLRMFIGVS